MNINLLISLIMALGISMGVWINPVKGTQNPDKPMIIKPQGQNYYPDTSAREDSIGDGDWGGGG